MTTTTTNDEQRGPMSEQYIPPVRVNVRKGLNFDVHVNPEDDSITIILVGSGTIALRPGDTRQMITIECRR